MEWGKVIAVACDDKDNVWILRRSEPSVLVLTSGGKFVKSWGQGLFAQGAHFIGKTVCIGVKKIGAVALIQAAV